MPTRVISSNIVASGDAVTSKEEDIVVSAGFTVTSTAGVGVVMTGDFESLLVYGNIQGAEGGVRLGSAANPTFQQYLSILEEGNIRTTSTSDPAVEVASFESLIVNRGIIRGGDVGIAYSGGTNHSLDNRQFGLIEAEEEAIIRYAAADTGSLTLTNMGTISTHGDYVYTSSNAQAEDIIRNGGTIVGHVSLGGSTDVYDGRMGGVVLGRVEGGAGNDRFFAGSAKETFLGGEGVDTLDLSAGNGVTVALGNTPLNSGIADDDVYGSIEIVIGTNGADTLIGSGSAETLFGGRGDDRLQGAAGADRLSGNVGNDTFVLNSQIGIDQVQDFRNNSGDNDRFEIVRAAFGINAPAGAITAGNFVKGTAPKATDKNDFIFYDTDDRLLFIDRDGTGAAAAVKVAELGTGTSLNFDDFILV